MLPADICKPTMWRNSKKPKKAETGPEIEEKIFEYYDLPRYLLEILNQVVASLDHQNPRDFSVTPETFEKYEDSGCFGKKMKTPWIAKMLKKEYNITIDDCGTPGIEIRLGFDHILKLTKKPMIDRLDFFVMTQLEPDRKKKQQEDIDHGVPEDIYVKYLKASIPAGLNPRVHERLNYDHLYIWQRYSGEERRIYHKVNDKMLKTKLLALSCFIADPEPLSKFQGWGLLIDYSQENKIDKSFIEDVIDKWIEGKPIRQLTALYDRQLGLNDKEETTSRGCVMSQEEEDAIVKKLTVASKYIETNGEDFIFQSFMHIKFVRKREPVEAELFITRENSKCVGMAFLYPPNGKMMDFVKDTW